MLPSEGVRLKTQLLVSSTPARVMVIVVVAPTNELTTPVELAGSAHVESVKEGTAALSDASVRIVPSLAYVLVPDTDPTVALSAGLVAPPMSAHELLVIGPNLMP